MPLRNGSSGDIAVPGQGRPGTFRPGRHDRTETARFRPFSYDELVARDKASLDIFRLRDESLEDTGNLPAPELIAAEIVEDLQAALDQSAAIAVSLGASDTEEYTARG